MHDYTWWAHIEVKELAMNPGFLQSRQSHSNLIQPESSFLEPLEWAFEEKRKSCLRKETAARKRARRCCFR